MAKPTQNQKKPVAKKAQKASVKVKKLKDFSAEDLDKVMGGYGGLPSTGCDCYYDSSSY